MSKGGCSASSHPLLSLSQQKDHLHLEEFKSLGSSMTNRLRLEQAVRHRCILHATFCSSLHPVQVSTRRAVLGGSLLYANGQTSFDRISDVVSAF